MNGAAGHAAEHAAVMVCAHLDEGRPDVVDVDGDGSLRIAAVGGGAGAAVVGQRVRIGADGVVGVVGLPPAHETVEAARARVDDRRAPHRPGRFDTGCGARPRPGRRRRGVDTAAVDLGPTILGKAMDDRAGAGRWRCCSAGAYGDIVGVFSAQEEAGMRGAGLAAIARPGRRVRAGVRHDGRHPKDRDDTPVMRVGDGPAITVMDSSMVADTRLFRHLVDTAEREGVRAQIRAPKGGGTDGGRIHLTRAGVPTAVVSAPCRYLHGPQAIVSKHDLAGMVGSAGHTTRTHAYVDVIDVSRDRVLR